MALVGSTLVVSGLPAAGTSVVTVTAVDPGLSWAQSSVTGSALESGTAPSLSSPVPTADGWTSTITNHSPDITHSATAKGGAAVTLTGASITVTGLAPRGTSTVTVTATRVGYTTETGSVTGSALLAGTPAQFGAPAAVQHGFTVEITNLDAAATYRATTSGGSVSLVGSRLTVTGLAPGATATVTVTVVRSGRTDATSSVTGSAAAAVTPPTTPASPTPTGGPTSGSPGNGTSSSSDTSSAGPDGSAVGHAPSFVDEQVPGSGAAYVDGSHVESTFHVTASGVSVTAAGLTMTVLALADGTPATPAPDGSITVSTEGTVRVAVRGFAPGTTATVWGYSTPVRLSDLSIAADRSGGSEFDLPASMQSGRHTLVVEGTSADGRPVALSVGILIADPSPVAGALQHAGAASPGAAGAAWMIGALVALTAGLLLVAARRRRQDPDGAPAAATE